MPLGARWGSASAGCVADELDVVVERDAAARASCARRRRDAGAVARVLASPPPSRCDEEQLYRCAGGSVVACAEHAVVGDLHAGLRVGGRRRSEATTPVTREAAFAILCSR